ncbi:efflux RND transporter permease subunit [Brackiella oedipodis]|uniref:efflux RND transporter permease subunit n=1 Tax=Brackiella oedipodis TaxID=124225 RepID=UPI00048A806B|nr:efflux RND transporter permease subunit [Brackiella oedipodis]
MNISAPFIQRPVATILLMVALLFAGITAYRQLAISALPEVDYPTIQVVTQYPGASPETIGRLVTSPLEKQLGQMAGLTQMSSSSSAGASVINLQFSLGLDISVAEQEVQAAINAANNLLPNDLPMPPVYNKVNPADTPVMTVAVTSSVIPLNEARDLIETRVLQKISQVPGVGLVNIAGGQKPAVRIQVDPRALASHDLTLDQLRQVITSSNINQPTGNLNGPRRSTTLQTNSQLENPKDYENLILNYNGDHVLRLGQVARAQADAEDLWQTAWYNKTPAILLRIQRQPGANVIAVVDAVAQLLPTLQKGLPESIQMQVVADRTISIRESIDHVQKEMVFAIILVVFITYVFLRSLSATLIPTVVVPLSLIGTFLIMYFLGFSLNNLTLMALTIATGFVVDDAIVMIENIARHVEEGLSPMQAAFKGAAEIGFTLVSLTISLIAVLIPLLFMGDIIGRLFNEFAVTLATAILISLVISLTLTPMMCGRMLRPESQQSDSRLHHYLGAWIDYLIRLYERGLSIVLKHQFKTLVFAIATLVLTAFLYIIVPKGFFPEQDNGLIQVITEAPQSVSFESMKKRQQALIDELLKEEQIERITASVGVDGENASLNTGRLQIELNNAQRSDNIDTVIQRLQESAKHVKGIAAYFQPSQDLSVDTTVSRSQYQLTLSTINAELLQQWVPDYVQALKAIKGVKDVVDDYQTQGLRVSVNVDRAAASRLGINMADIEEALYNSFSQRLISTIFTQSAQYRVVLEVDPSYRSGLENLQDVYVRGRNGLVRLDQIARIEPGFTPVEIQRIDQFPATLISFNLEEGYSLSDVSGAIQDCAEKIGMPAAIEMRFQGSSQAFQDSLSNTLWLLAAAIFTMYIVLGVLYESFIHPVTILSTLPSAAIGALIALIISGNQLDMVGIIGIILLIGIVKKNAILIIDFALQAERQQGLSPLEAVRQACLLRFRPILMTTLAALFGAIPLMMASGMGSELRQPLGISMVGGLLCSQLLTLFTTPVVYLYFEKLSKLKFGKGKTA